MNHCIKSDQSIGRTHWPAVFSICLVMFALVGVELLPISLVTPMALDLGVTIGVAGQAITVTALVAAAASPLIIIASGQCDRRKLVIILSATISVSAIVSAVTTSYASLLCARVLLGMSLGGLWALVPSLSLRLVPTAAVPRAMAIVFMGVTAAGAFAPSAGLLLSNLWGWRVTFGALSVIGFIALISTIVYLPKLPATRHTRVSSFGLALESRAVKLGLVTVLLVLTGHFAAFTYIRPILEHVTSLKASGIAVMFLLFGLATVVGSFLGGIVSQRNLAESASASASTVALATLAVLATRGEISFSMVFVALWGIAFGAFPVVMSAWNVRASCRDTEAAGALMATSFQVAIATGASMGGTLIDHFGTTPTVVFSGTTVLLGSLIMLIFGRPIERATSDKFSAGVE